MTVWGRLKIVNQIELSFSQNVIDGLPGYRPFADNADRPAGHVHNGGTGTVFNERGDMVKLMTPDGIWQKLAGLAYGA